MANQEVRKICIQEMRPDVSDIFNGCSRRNYADLYKFIDASLNTITTVSASKDTIINEMTSTWRSYVLAAIELARSKYVIAPVYPKLKPISNSGKIIPRWLETQGGSAVNEIGVPIDFFDPNKLGIGDLPLFLRPFDHFLEYLDIDKGPIGLGIARVENPTRNRIAVGLNGPGVIISPGEILQFPAVYRVSAIRQ